MSSILTSEVEDKRLRDRPRKSWMEVINSYSRSLNANIDNVENRNIWRMLLDGEAQANLADIEGHVDRHASRFVPYDDDNDQYTTAVPLRVLL